MSWPGAAWWQRSYSSWSVRTLCSASTNSRPCRRVTSTTAMGSLPTGSSSESKDPLRCLHEPLALLLLEHLAHRAVLRGGDGQAQRARSTAREQEEDDVRRLAKCGASDARVGQEAGVPPDPVPVEADMDARGQGQDEDEVERHHRLAEDVMDRTVHGAVEDRDRAAHHSEYELQREGAGGGEGGGGGGGGAAPGRGGAAGPAPGAGRGGRQGP